MTANKYELAVNETRSVLGEWMDLIEVGQRIDSPHTRDIIAREVVSRLIAKGVIQSTDEADLVDYRTGPLKPGRTVVGGDVFQADDLPTPGSVLRES
jgi:hypothetical protein